MRQAGFGGTRRNKLRSTRQKIRARQMVHATMLGFSMAQLNIPIICAVLNQMVTDLQTLG